MNDINAYGFSDAAKRLSDTVNMHAIAGSWGKWIAVRLSDGGTDGVLYDSRADAIRHQLHEKLCAYVLVPIDGMTLRAAESYMRFVRQAYDAGFRLADPGGPDHIPALTREHARNQHVLLTK